VPLSMPLHMQSLIGSSVITNAGQFPAAPTITLTGTLENPVVRNATTGRQVRFNYTLTPGDYLVIDVENAKVTLNGERGMRYLAPGSQLTRLVLVRGQNTIQVAADDGEGQAEIEYYDLYLGVDW